MILSRAWRPGAGTAPPRFLAGSDASRPERSYGTLGRNKRPCEEQTKIDADKISCTEIFMFELVLNCDKIIKLLELNIKA